jgi:hypothetical protein
VDLADHRQHQTSLQTDELSSGTVAACPLLFSPQKGVFVNQPGVFRKLFIIFFLYRLFSFRAKKISKPPEFNGSHNIYIYIDVALLVLSKLVWTLALAWKFDIDPRFEFQKTPHCPKFIF